MRYFVFEKGLSPEDARSEIRRINEELDRVKAQPAMDAAARRRLPTLRRDPVTGEWRVV